MRHYASAIFRANEPPQLAGCRAPRTGSAFIVVPRQTSPPQSRNWRRAGSRPGARRPCFPRDASVARHGTASGIGRERQADQECRCGDKGELLCGARDVPAFVPLREPRAGQVAARRLLLAVDARAGRRVVRAVECRPTRQRRECRRRRLLAWASDSQGVCWRLALRAGEQAGRVVLACADSDGGAVAAAVGALRSRAAPMAAAADQDGHVPCGRGSAGPGVSGSALRRG